MEVGRPFGQCATASPSRTILANGRAMTAARMATISADQFRPAGAPCKVCTSPAGGRPDRCQAWGAAVEPRRRQPRSRSAAFNLECSSYMQVEQPAQS